MARDVDEVSGVTNSTYIPTARDTGKDIKVRVSFVDDAGFSETRTSDPTAQVAAAPSSPSRLVANAAMSPADQTVFREWDLSVRPFQLAG